MGTISIIAVVKLAIKSGIFIAGCIGVAGGLNWMNKKQFNKKGGSKLDHAEIVSEGIVHRH